MPKTRAHDECEIDGGDPLTDVDGNAELQPGLSSSRPVITCTSGTPYWDSVDGDEDGADPTVDPVTYVLEAAGISDPEADYGAVGRGKAASVKLSMPTPSYFEVVPANQPVSRTRAETAVFKGGTSKDVKMGKTLKYEIQLVNRDGVEVGPNPFEDSDGDQDYIVTIEKQRVLETEDGDDTLSDGSRAIVSVTQMRPDGDGKIKIVVTNPDPAAGLPNNDVLVHCHGGEGRGQQPPLGRRDRQCVGAPPDRRRASSHQPRSP